MSRFTEKVPMTVAPTASDVVERKGGSASDFFSGKRGEMVEDTKHTRPPMTLFRKPVKLPMGASSATQLFSMTQ